LNSRRCRCRGCSSTTQLGISNWTLSFVRLLIGLAVYFGYGYSNSKLGRVAVAK